jgi:hypothetical protein
MEIIGMLFYYMQKLDTCEELVSMLINSFNWNFTRGVPTNLPVEEILNNENIDNLKVQSTIDEKKHSEKISITMKLGLRNFLIRLIISGVFRIAADYYGLDEVTTKTLIFIFLGLPIIRPV